MSAESSTPPLSDDITDYESPPEPSSPIDIPSIILNGEPLDDFDECFPFLGSPQSPPSPRYDLIDPIPSTSSKRKNVQSNTQNSSDHPRKTRNPVQKQQRLPTWARRPVNHGSNLSISPYDPSKYTLSGTTFIPTVPASSTTDVGICKEDDPHDPAASHVDRPPITTVIVTSPPLVCSDEPREKGQARLTPAFTLHPIPRLLSPIPLHTLSSRTPNDSPPTSLRTSPPVQMSRLMPGTRDNPITLLESPKIAVHDVDDPSAVGLPTVSEMEILSSDKVLFRVDRNLVSAHSHTFDKTQLVELHDPLRETAKTVELFVFLCNGKRFSDILKIVPLRSLKPIVGFLVKHRCESLLDSLGSALRIHLLTTRTDPYDVFVIDSHADDHITCALAIEHAGRSQPDTVMAIANSVEDFELSDNVRGSSPFDPSGFGIKSMMEIPRAYYVALLRAMCVISARLKEGEVARWSEFSREFERLMDRHKSQIPSYAVRK